jgi:hypothetical protein
MHSISDTSTWSRKPCKASTTRSAAGCHLFLRYDEARARPQNPPVSAARDGDYAAEPGVGDREKDSLIFRSAKGRDWPIATFSPLRSLPLRTRADIGQPIRLSFGQTLLGRAPPTRRSRSISRPNDRSTEPASGLRPFGSRSLRQEHRRAYDTPASITDMVAPQS